MSAPTRALDVDLLVERRLEEVLDDARARAAAFGPRCVLLWSEIARGARGGKRFRSALVLRTHAALGGDHLDAAARPDLPREIAGNRRTCAARARTTGAGGRPLPRSRGDVGPRGDPDPPREAQVRAVEAEALTS